jgi:cold shock CspA family protein
MSSSTETETQETSNPRITGQVKWFNNKAGYGFITVSSGDQNGKDIFVHYSTIRVVNSQYKYLIQGEYVDFELVKSTSETHEYQAIDITGINGGSLMCETRRNNVISNDVPRPRRYEGRPRVSDYRNDREKSDSYSSRRYEGQPRRYESNDRERDHEQPRERRPRNVERVVDEEGYTSTKRVRSNTNRKSSTVQVSH